MYYYSFLPILVILPLSILLLERTLSLFVIHIYNETSQTSSLLANPIKSPADHRNYRAVQLTNQIKVILVSDPHTEKSAASLDVMAGSLHDPDELPGLAHYLEHFVFLGSENQSPENALDKYLAENGGSYNAHTYTGNSWYHFQCAPEGLDGALDRFAKLFVAPYFSDLLREGVANALNSEYEGFLPDDAWRLRRVATSKCKPSHPYSRFKPGNKWTLWTRPMEFGIDVRAELFKFYESHYSANVMTLAVIGQESLDDLQTMVETHFLSIPDRGVPIPTWPESHLGPNELQTRMDIVPVMDLRHLYLNFPLPDYTTQLRSGAVDYVITLIEHGGPGGLLSLLRRKKWASNLSVNYNVLARGFAETTIEITITHKGLQNVDDIILHTFQYLKMLRDKGPQKWFWDEMKVVKETEFRYLEDQDPEDLVVELASLLINQPPDQVWTSRYLWTNYDEDLIKEILDLLIPSNFQLITQAKQNVEVVTHKEEYFRVDYSYKKIEPEVIQRWVNCGLHEELKLPSANEFIPTVFDLKPRENEGRNDTPRIIFDDELSRIWFLQDTEFLLPRASVMLEIHNPHTSQSARNGNFQTLFANLMIDLLTESTYSVTKAGLHFVILSIHNGIALQFQGYDHKLPIIFTHVLESLLNFTVSIPKFRERFEDIKETYIRSLKNLKDEEPYHQAQHHLRHLIRSQGYHYDELLVTAPDVTFENVMDYARLILSRIRLQWIVCGNLVVEEAVALHELAMKHFTRISSRPMNASEVPQLPQQLLLPSGSNFLYRVEEEIHSQSAVLVYFQGEMADLRGERVILTFIEQILSEPCFDILRTKEQLGYVVYCSRREEASAFSGFQIVVQGEKNVNYTEWRIEEFLNTISGTINNLTMEEFSKYKDSVRTVIRAEKPKTLNSRTHAIDQEIERGTYDFDRESQDVAKLENITLEQVQNFFNTWINPTSPERKILTVHVISKRGRFGESIDRESVTSNFILDHSLSREREVVEDVGSWKGRLGYIQPPKPYTNIPLWKIA